MASTSVKSKRNRTLLITALVILGALVAVAGVWYEQVSQPPANLSSFASLMSAPAPSCRKTASSYDGLVGVGSPPSMVVNFTCSGGYDEINDYLSGLLARNDCPAQTNPTGGPNSDLLIDCSGNSTSGFQTRITMHLQHPNDPAFLSGGNALPTDNPAVASYQVVIADVPK